MIGWGKLKLAARASIGSATNRIHRIWSARIGGKAVGYWSRAVAVLLVSILLAPWFERVPQVKAVRASVFQFMGEHTPRMLSPRYVKVLMINDEDYWKGDPRGQVPLNRRYLAKLVHALAQANAAVIALDVNEALSDPDKPDVDITDDTKQLMTEIATAAKSRTIVLAKVFRGNSYELAPDIFGAFGICRKALPNGQWENPGTKAFHLGGDAKQNIVCGFVGKPITTAQVPPQIDVPGESQPVDSFALAIARAWSPRDALALDRTERLTEFIPLNIVTASGSILSAGKLLSGDAATLHAVRFRPVIIGGNWHVDGYLSGEFVDTHATPLEPMRGAIINENYVEAILDGRIHEKVAEWKLRVLEILTAIGATIAFAYLRRRRTKVMLFAGILACLTVVQWSMYALTGTYFEAFLPVFGLMLHSLVDRQIG